MHPFDGPRVEYLPPCDPEMPPDPNELGDQPWQVERGDDKTRQVGSFQKVVEFAGDLSETGSVNDIRVDNSVHQAPGFGIGTLGFKWR